MSIKSISYSILFITLLIFPQISKAGFIPQECLDEKAENCGLEQFTELFVFLYYFSLKYLGALALLLFVVGGIMWLTSGGNQERVAKGRKILVGTTVGIMIVLGSFAIVSKMQEYIGVSTGNKETGSPNFRIQENPDINKDKACRMQNGTCMQCTKKNSDPKEPIDCLPTTADVTHSCQGKFVEGLCPGGKDNMCCI